MNESCESLCKEYKAKKFETNGKTKLHYFRCYESSVDAVSNVESFTGDSMPTEEDVVCEGLL